MRRLRRHARAVHGCIQCRPGRGRVNNDSAFAEGGRSTGSDTWKMKITHRGHRGNRKQRRISIPLVWLSLCPLWLVFFSPTPSKGLDMPVQERSRIRAPELTGDRGWLNTEKPLSLAALKGKVVLLDFWTYGCINCIHIIPDLKKLEKKYANQLVVIGVHSAKFENEKDTDNIRQIILRYEIEHPIVNDADFAIWKSYAVNAWPTRYLIDPAGYIIGRVSGEGYYEEIDKA